MTVPASIIPGRIITLQLGRIALCEMLEEDQKHFHEWLVVNAELRTLIDDKHVPSFEDQLRWFRHSQGPDRKFFSIFVTDNSVSPVLIGNGGFVDIDKAKHTAVFRITIGHSAYIGKGYGSEAIRALLSYGFTTLDFLEITLRVLAKNKRAIHVYENIGFSRTKEENGNVFMRITPSQLQ